MRQLICISVLCLCTSVLYAQKVRTSLDTTRVADKKTKVCRHGDGICTCGPGHVGPCKPGCRCPKAGRPGQPPIQPPPVIDIPDDTPDAGEPAKTTVDDEDVVDSFRSMFDHLIRINSKNGTGFGNVIATRTHDKGVTVMLLTSAPKVKGVSEVSITWQGKADTLGKVIAVDKGNMLAAVIAEAPAGFTPKRASIATQWPHADGQTPLFFFSHEKLTDYIWKAYTVAYAKLSQDGDKYYVPGRKQDPIQSSGRNQIILNVKTPSESGGSGIYNNSGELFAILWGTDSDDETYGTYYETIKSFLGKLPEPYTWGANGDTSTITVPPITPNHNHDAIIARIKSLEASQVALIKNLRDTQGALADGHKLFLTLQTRLTKLSRKVDNIHVGNLEPKLDKLAKDLDAQIARYNNTILRVQFLDKNKELIQEERYRIVEEPVRMKFNVLKTKKKTKSTPAPDNALKNTTQKVPKAQATEEAAETPLPFELMGAPDE